MAIDLFGRACEHCKKPLGICRPDKKFCSTKCYQRHWYDRPSFPYKRTCRACKKPFVVSERADANRQYCGRACATEAARKGSKTWINLHPEKRSEYSQNEKRKNPHVWRDRRRADRTEILNLLGGKCLACGTNNPLWLHVDYVPTCKNERHRHSTTLKFVRANLSLFRVLCANHHYELTLTGKIEGTDIGQ